MLLNAISKHRLLVGTVLVASACLMSPHALAAATTPTAECSSHECSAAMEQLIKFSLNGSPDAQVIVALAYATGDGVAVDKTLARQHLKRALRNNDARAWHIYSRWLREGFTVEQDVTEADYALNRAARHDYLPAIYERAVRSFSETAMDNSSAVADLEQGASQLHKPSMYLLAQIKAAGLGVTPDTQHAAQLYAFLARSNYLQSSQRLELLVGSDNFEEQTEQLSLQLVNEMATEFRGSDIEPMEVVTVTSATITTEDFVIDLADTLGGMRLFDGSSTGSRIRGQVCGSGTASCRVIYNAAAGTVSVGGTVNDAINGGGF